MNKEKDQLAVLRRWGLKMKLIGSKHNPNKIRKSMQNLMIK